MSDDIRPTPGNEPQQENPRAHEDEPEILEIEGLPRDAPPPSMTESSGAGTLQSAAGDDADSGAEVQALRDRVTHLEEDLLRVRADFENFRKRQVRERTESSRLAAAELVTALLPVLDNFRRALDADPGDSELADSYRQGVRMIHEQLCDVLRRAGLTPIDTEGQVFDPNFHEAVARQEIAGAEPNTITAEIEPGYLFRDRLLKAARVCVAVAPAD